MARPDKLRDAVEDTFDQVLDRSKGVREVGQDVVDRGRELGQDVVDKGQEVVGKGQEVVDKGQEAGAAIGSRVAAAIREVQKRLKP